MKWLPWLQRHSNFHEKRTRVRGKQRHVQPRVNRLSNQLSSQSDFYRTIRDTILLVSSAVWAWVRLCFTPQNFSIDVEDRSRRKAESILEELGHRVFEGVSRKDGIKALLELFFLEIFTTGRFAGEIVPLSSGKGIDYFHTIDPFLIQWEKKGRWIPYVYRENEKVALNNDRFYYYGLGGDIRNPGGVSPIAAIPFVAEVEQKMLEDMALSSHNAGMPRLHVKISPPEPLRGESQKKFAERLESYFDSTVDRFRSLDADDNIFTWSDVDIELISGGGNMNWRMNREQVIEDVITGMRLFPWVVGRTHGTTKNWVQSQFNMLMQEVESFQAEASALAEWIRNTELWMKGIQAVSTHQFDPNQDPFVLEKAKTQAVQYETINKKVERGYISKEQGARELGYSTLFREENADNKETQT